MCIRDRSKVTPNGNSTEVIKTQNKSGKVKMKTSSVCFLQLRDTNERIRKNVMSYAWSVELYGS